MHFEIKIDKEKFLAQPQKVRQDFQTNMFSLGATLTADFGASIDWSDTFHWKIDCLDNHEQEVRLLLPKYASLKSACPLGENKRVSGTFGKS